MADIIISSALWAIVALFCLREAGQAMRVSIAAFMAAAWAINHEEWVSSFKLLLTFGPRIYPALHALHRDGLLERRQDSSEPRFTTRGGRPVFYYRWVGTPGSGN